MTRVGALRVALAGVLLAEAGLASPVVVRIRPRAVVVTAVARPHESLEQGAARLAPILARHGREPGGPVTRVLGPTPTLEQAVRGDERTLLEAGLRLRAPRLVLRTEARPGVKEPVERCRAAAGRLRLSVDGPATIRAGAVEVPVSPRGVTDVAVYTGRGTFAPGLWALSTALETAGITIRVVGAADLRNGDPAKLARVVVVPGGWAGDYVEDVGKPGADRILAFVEGGGGYLGICAGAYFAARRIVWEGESLPYPLDLFPGTPTGAIRQIAPWPGHALTGLRLDARHPITRGLPPTREALYYGGPALRARDGAKVSVVARFAKVGEPAMVAFSRGRGRVLLCSVHPEIRLGGDRAAIGWPDRKVAVPDPESDRDLLIRGVRWLLGRTGERAMSRR